MKSKILTAWNEYAATWEALQKAREEAKKREKENEEALDKLQELCVVGTTYETPDGHQLRQGPMGFQIIPPVVKL